MFYRNVAGQVVVLPFLGLKSNQDPITSGASLTILKDGTSSSSAGTLTHVSGGVWKYAFTAGETDAEIVGMILTATDAMPVVYNLATAAAGSGTGTGARTVTVTVNDGTTVLQNAAVRLTEGANSFKGLTNVSGVVTFNVDDATYTVGITKGGYSYAGTTLVVDGAEAVTYSMTANTIPEPSTPDKTVLTILCLNSTGDAASGVSISIRYAAIPVDSEDIAFPGGTITGTSNGSGVASFEVIKGATIEYKRGTRDVWLEAVMSDEDTTSITSFIGTP